MIWQAVRIACSSWSRRISRPAPGLRGAARREAARTWGRPRASRSSRGRGRSGRGAGPGGRRASTSCRQRSRFRSCGWPVTRSSRRSRLRSIVGRQSSKVWRLRSVESRRWSCHERRSERVSSGTTGRRTTSRRKPMHDSRRSSWSSLRSTRPERKPLMLGWRTPLSRDRSDCVVPVSSITSRSTSPRLVMCQDYSKVCYRIRRTDARPRATLGQHEVQKSCQKLPTTANHQLWL